MAYQDGRRQKGGWAYRQNTSLKNYIRQRDSYTCQICGEEGWIIDHIVPWAISHDSRIENLRVLCHRCNLALRRKRRDANPHDTLRKWFAHIDAELKAELTREAERAGGEQSDSSRSKVMAGAQARQ